MGIFNSVLIFIGFIRDRVMVLFIGFRDKLVMEGLF